MIFNIERKTLTINNNLAYEPEIISIYNLVSHEGSCKEVIDMFERFMLEVKTPYLISQDGSYLITERDDDEYQLGVYMTKWNSVDNGYYTYGEDGDDEYVPYYEDVCSYYKINNCPLCGESFEFNIIEKGDITAEHKRITDAIDSYKGRLSKKKREELNSLYEELDKLLNSDLSFK